VHAEAGAVKGRVAGSQAERTLSRPDAIGMRMMTVQEATEWYLMFPGETTGRQSGANVAGVGAEVGREIKTARGIIDADGQGHRLHERRIGGEPGALIEIGTLGLTVMTVIDSQICVCLHLPSTQSEIWLL
jgi:hypothetical protein